MNGGVPELERGWGCAVWCFFGAFAAAAWIGDALYLVPGKHNGLLYNVSTTDPIALGAAAAGVILIALVSGAIPARRLARIDPVKTLRTE
jgi:hypothetical protein